MDSLLSVRISKCINGQLCSGMVVDIVVGKQAGERLYLIEQVRTGGFLWVSDRDGAPAEPQMDVAAEEEDV